ncbi:MAG: hypothetical protein JXB88_16405 [Spirochaetales bacterium]|nr:hypothetical protein [Spirochaetales bacterium]
MLFLFRVRGLANATALLAKIFVYDGSLKDNLVWEETEVAFVIDDNDFWIMTTLQLANNVVLKFRSGSELVLDLGAACLVNYNGTGVAFTSYKDDSLKGTL